MSGELELALDEVPTSKPKVDEMLVRIDLAPMSQFDLMASFGAADLSTA